MKPLEGMSVVPDKSFFRPELIVIDVPYSPLETKMRSMAKEVGCKTMNGLGMMLFQGAAAFKLWTGKDMPIEHMKEFYKDFDEMQDDFYDGMIITGAPVEQMDFDALQEYNSPAVPSEMMEKLEAVDVETLTPIEALNFLYELKKTLKGSLNG